MIREETVLILGAGASVDLGYPTGAQLIDVIHNNQNEALLPNQDDPTQPIKDYFHQVYEVISQVQILNIDTFLRDNPSLDDQGKILIAYFLLKHEHPIGARMDILPRLQQRSSWLLYLFNAVTRGCTSDDDLMKSLSNLKIITFNYDLSLEAFFLSHFVRQERYKAITQELMKRLEVIHIYGKLYDLIYQGKFSLADYASYPRSLERYKGKPMTGEKANYRNFERAREIAGNLHVIGEQKQSALASSENVLRAKQCPKEAKHVHTLGFAFDIDNLSLLQGISWRGKGVSYTNMEKSEQLKLTAHQFFDVADYLGEHECSAYEAAMNRIAW